MSVAAAAAAAAAEPLQQQKRMCTGVRVGNNDVRPGVEKRKPCTKNQFNKPIRGVGTLTANAMSLNVTRPKGKSVSKNL